MNATTIRQELHDYINAADDTQLKAIYAIIKDDVNEPYEWWNDDELIVELERRSADLKSGKDSFWYSLGTSQRTLNEHS